jgi:predicted NBD/HSP70 family sugar kinase
VRSPVVLGLDFGGTKIAGAVCDMTGFRLGSMTIDTRAADGAQTSLERGLLAARSLLDTSAGGRPLAAVGACTIGIPSENGISLAPTIPGWGALVLDRELRRVFEGAEIRLATDVKAAAQAEAEWGALAGCDPGIYLNLGTGLAVAIVANGAVVAGSHGAAGEIGYNLRHLTDVGQLLDDRLPLEGAVSGMALTRAARNVFPTAESAAAVFERAADNPWVARLVTDFIAELSYHLVNLAIAVDPARIVVGGGMVRSWNQLYGGLREALDAAVPFPPDLVRADFPFDAPLMGALALGLAAAREVRGEEVSA